MAVAFNIDLSFESSPTLPFLDHVNVSLAEVPSIDFQVPKVLLTSLNAPEVTYVKTLEGVIHQRR